MPIDQPSTTMWCAVTSSSATCSRTRTSVTRKSGARVDVKRLVRLDQRDAFRFLARFRFGKRRQVDDRNVQRDGRLDDLARLAVFAFDERPQRFVARAQEPPGLGEVGVRNVALQTPAHRDVERRVARRELFLEPEALLRLRAHGAAAAPSRRTRPTVSSSASLRARAFIAASVPSPRRDRYGPAGSRTAAARRRAAATGSGFASRWRARAATVRCCSNSFAAMLKPVLVGPCGDREELNRVAAKRQEIVVAPDALELQHVGPDLRQRDLGRRRRRR